MQYKVDQSVIMETVVLGQNVIKHSNRKIHHTDIASIRRFILRANNGKSAMRISMRDCEKILNIAKAYL